MYSMYEYTHSVYCILSGVARNRYQKHTQHFGMIRCEKFWYKKIHVDIQL